MRAKYLDPEEVRVELGGLRLTKEMVEERALKVLKELNEHR